MLTPGVPVMDRLTASLEEHFKCRQAEGKLPAELKVTVSGPREPGEGEHKIMLQLVRNESAKAREDENHVIVGTDSDLFLVPVALLGAPRAVCVARCEEAIDAQGRRTCLRVCQTHQMVQSILRQFVKLAAPASSPTPKEEQQVRLDFICVTCLRGNDYLPELMSDVAVEDLWPRYLRWRGAGATGLVDSESDDSGEHLVLLRGAFADFLGGLGGAWSPQKVTAWSAKEGAQQYVEALMWCLETYATGHCPDLQRRFCAALQHFASAALIAQQLPILEPGCCKALRSDAKPLSPMACALAVLPVADVRCWLLPQQPSLAPLLEESGLLGEVAKLETCRSCQRLTSSVVNGPTVGKKAEKNRKALEVHRREHQDIDAVSLEALDAEVHRLISAQPPEGCPAALAALPAAEAEETKPKRAKRRRR
ncbi:unnamed protein product [Cladocopium goreaui]|uniref:5'-3' exoribonuclease 2 n=1 Tax=Cladocopium goreaui TaxID=2562237 RepID=A0A9P1FLF1_9DINO|nr:unnamed protein product [Cladocopium goreaui]